MDLSVRVKCDFSDLKKARKQLAQEVRGSMRIAGDLYLSVAVNKGSYQNRTGNLRSANAYAITDNGQIIEEKVANTFSKIEAQNKAKEALKRAKAPGQSLIMVNGMFYGSFVEAKGFDVSSMAYIRAVDKLEAKIK